MSESQICYIIHFLLKKDNFVSSFYTVLENAEIYYLNNNVIKNYPKRKLIKKLILVVKIKRLLRKYIT